MVSSCKCANSGGSPYATNLASRANYCTSGGAAPRQLAPHTKPAIRGKYLCHGFADRPEKKFTTPSAKFFLLSLGVAGDNAIFLA